MEPAALGVKVGALVPVEDDSCVPTTCTAGPPAVDADADPAPHRAADTVVVASCTWLAGLKTPAKLRPAVSVPPAWHCRSTSAGDPTGTVSCFFPKLTAACKPTAGPPDTVTTTFPGAEPLATVRDGAGGVHEGTVVPLVGRADAPRVADTPAVRLEPAGAPASHLNQ